MDDQIQETKEHYDGPLVLVARFRGLPEAMVAKSILDSAEIDSFLTDEKVIGMVYPNLIGMIKLMVRPEDLEAAVQLLNVDSTQENSLKQETDLEELFRKAGRSTESGDEGK